MKAILFQIALINHVCIFLMQKQAEAQAPQPEDLRAPQGTEARHQGAYCCQALRHQEDQEGKQKALS